MRRSRDIVLYIAVTLSSVAAAYVLKEWLPHLLARGPFKPDDDKTTRASQQTRPKPERHADGPPAAHHTVLTPTPDVDPRSPTTSQTKALPPLDTHSLPPPLPNGRALLSRSSFILNPDGMPSPTSATTFGTSSVEDGVADEGASHANSSDPLEESFVDVLSPPPHDISRRRSVRAHDLFASSHISFAELGTLVAPEDESK